MIGQTQDEARTTDSGYDGTFDNDQHRHLNTNNALGTADTRL